MAIEVKGNFNNILSPENQSKTGPRFSKILLKLTRNYRPGYRKWPGNKDHWKLFDQVLGMIQVILTEARGKDFLGVAMNSEILLHFPIFPWNMCLKIYLELHRSLKKLLPCSYLIDTMIGWECTYRLRLRIGQR
ncbi:MAG: hypothetical protein K1X82_07910 [Bacteroidia bacterium]|nr:hypothetical protein [Bacteroidia bacterium]